MIETPPLQLLCHKGALRVAETGVPVFVRPHYVAAEPGEDPRLIGCQIGVDAAV